MIEYFKRVNRGIQIQKQRDYSKDCWIKVVNPDEKEIDFLVEKFNLEKDLIIDGLDVYEIPRIEEENKKAYFFITVPTSKVENEYTSSFLIIISKDLFITISKNDLEIFNKISNAKNFLTNKRMRGLLQILLFLSNDYNSRIRAILKEVKKDRKKIRNLNKQDILNLVLQEDILNDYLSSFSPLINMHSMMLRLHAIKFKESEKEFIEDLIVDLNQTLNSCKSALKSITNMRDYYSTTLSHSLNKIITILTVFTILLTIPTVLSGIYGMNIKLPFQNHTGIFEILIGIIILIWAIILIVFKKSKIL